MKNTDVTKSNGPDGHHIMLTAQDFAALGAQNLAFVRKVLDEGGQAQWAIFAADGTPIGMAPSRDVAFAAVRQHDLEPLSVH